MQIPFKCAIGGLTIILCGMAGAVVLGDAPPELDKCNVVWTTPSRDAAGSMPLGNGEVGINLWVEENGDLLFYISRSDAYSEISRLLKVGKVRVSLLPNPFASGKPFRQELLLRDGCCKITAGSGENQIMLRIFVDAEHPLIYLVGEANSPVSVTATAESWRTDRRVLPPDENRSAWTMHDSPFPLIESADVFSASPDNAVCWYHRNEDSVVPNTLKHQGLEAAAGTLADPLLHRTFGGWMTGPGMKAEGRSLKSAGPVKSFSLRIAAPCRQTATPEEWIRLARKIAGATSDYRQAMRRTAQWWRAFWNRSWIFVNGDQQLTVVSRGYTLQRYVQACGGRGNFPIKFNGGIFTVEPKAMGRPFNADWREWGDCHWWQNVRLPYHPMLAAGDFEMMDPLIRLYETVRPLCEARAKLYHGAQGCYFPETMTVWGTYSNGDYGWNRAGHQPKDVLAPWWCYAWNQGPELVALMLDRWDYTGDETFLKAKVLPMAQSVLRYFDTRFRKDAQGKIVLDPTQSVETYQTGVINDMPAVAGLYNITARLCALPKKITTPEQRALFAKMQFACPPVPTQEKELRGKKVRTLAPAEKYVDRLSNCENPELYAIWPFRLFGLGKPNLDQARAAYDLRRNHLDVGWGYDGNCAAVLGLADEAARILLIKCGNSNPAYRWPATWGPNFDWLPDQDHGSNLLETTQLMLLQADGDAIRLLPAWPKDWDVHFKLHAPRRTVIECVYRNGQIEKLVVSPDSRRKDIVISNTEIN